MEAYNEDLNIKLSNFEGPLDLLLHLIRINEIDIYDIPISLITSQYLEAIQQIHQINLDLAGDFLLMASTLAQIKSRLLLPVPESHDEGHPAEDPRMELVKPLLEYDAYQRAADELSARPILERDVFVRGGDGLETLDLAPGQELPKPEQRVAKASSYELVKAWRYLVDLRSKEEPTLSFFMETVTIGQKISQIRAFLIASKTAHFLELLSGKSDNFELALCFLATLELARTGFLRLWQDREIDTLGPKLYLADPTAAANLENLDYR
jgi:segregation and condensation protein A